MLCVHNNTNIAKKLWKTSGEKFFKIFFGGYLFLKTFCLILQSQTTGNGGEVINKVM